MAKYINEFTELREYRDMSVRHAELLRDESRMDFDRHEGWCDTDMEVLRHNAYVAVKKYREAIGKRIDDKTDEFYDELEFAHTFKPKKNFWDRFKKK